MNFREEYKSCAEIMSPSEEAMERMKKNILEQAAAPAEKKAFPFKRIAMIGGPIAACAVITVAAVAFLPKDGSDMVVGTVSSAAAAEGAADSYYMMDETSAESVRESGTTDREDSFTAAAADGSEEEHILKTEADAYDTAGIASEGGFPAAAQTAFEDFTETTGGSSDTTADIPVYATEPEKNTLVSEEEFIEEAADSAAPVSDNEGFTVTLESETVFDETAEIEVAPAEPSADQPAEPEPIYEALEFSPDKTSCFFMGYKYILDPEGEYYDNSQITLAGMIVRVIGTDMLYTAEFDGRALYLTDSGGKFIGVYIKE